MLLLLVLAALLALRIVALHFNATDLFFDEAQYWSWSLEPAFGYYSKPPLIAWIIGLATSACGTSEFCVRLPSPIIHTLTSLLVYLLAARLYDPRTGFWAGVVFATLPGISFSSGLISTDVPLLCFWALALLSLHGLLRERKALWPGLLLGLALGAGLNAKYAMAYFVLCTAIYTIATPEHRFIWRDRRWWLALAIGMIMIVPNLLWNLENGFATFSHTADNAKWTGVLFHPNKAAEFFLAQFGVFGPILFGALLVIVWRAYHHGLPSPDRLLLAFALPIVLIITVQAFLSRAHANWAAVSYVAATMLVTATMLRDGARGWFNTSLGLHLLLIPVMAVGLAVARDITLPGTTNPFARTLGWSALAQATRNRIEDARTKGTPYAAVLTVERAVTAELLYYMRASGVSVLAWPAAGRPKDHYQLTRPIGPGTAGPLLVVSLRPLPASLQQRLQAPGNSERITVPTGQGAQRSVHFLTASAFKR